MSDVELKIVRAANGFLVFPPADHPNVTCCADKIMIAATPDDLAALVKSWAEGDGKNEQDGTAQHS